jgi:hypothetical protein
MLFGMIGIDAIRAFPRFWALIALPIAPASAWLTGQSPPQSQYCQLTVTAEVPLEGTA